MVEEITVPGATIIEDAVVTSIAGEVAKEVEGVYRLGVSSIRQTIAERLGAAEARTRGVKAAVGTKETAIDLTMTVIYGYNIPEVANKVRQKVNAKVSELTGLVVKEINIDVNEIYFPEKEKEKGQLE
mgnify:CR=1 FL=1